jgi:kynurenine formamidase
MIATLSIDGRKYSFDMNQPLDISIPLRAGEQNVNAWYASPVRIEPVVMGDWIGDVNKGGSVNFRNVFLNPHGNGTHTECVGHISKENYSLNEQLRTYFFIAELITILPEKQGDDNIITLHQVRDACGQKKRDAIIIRTLPNEPEKLTHHYSNTNPPYLHHDAAEWLVASGIQHLLLDLPSVDREKDEGKLLAHHAFWQYPYATRDQCTITEMIYVPSEIPDGFYLLNLQITALENDASPSKPVLYALTEQS